MSDFDEMKDELHEKAEPAGTAEAAETVEPVEAEAEEETSTFPCIPLRGLTIFPRTIMHFDIGREEKT